VGSGAVASEKRGYCGKDGEGDMRADEIRNGGLGAFPTNIETEIAAQLAELNECFYQRHGDYGRRLNNILCKYADNWESTESSARMILLEIAGIVGWRDYPPKKGG
jgi:hypothetical protein